VSTPALYFPDTLADAADILDAYDGTAKVVAGGTALTLLLQQRLVAPQALVSLRDVPGLRDVTYADGVMRFGALVSHSDVARHPEVHRRLPLLAESFAVVGNAQVRAAATVGGVLAEADYASDPPAALLALDAEAIVHGPEGDRRIGMRDLVIGFYQTALSPSEILRETVVPVPPAAAGSAYLKYTARSREDRPCVGAAALVRLAGDGTCAELRLAVGAATDVPVRLPEVERSAIGRGLDESVLAELGDAYADGIEPLVDVRGSAWYRREMVRVWARRAIGLARERCAGEQSAMGNGSAQ